MQTKELLKDPVVCEDGYSYEAKVVKKAGRKYHINHLLKEIIEELKSEKDVSSFQTATYIHRLSVDTIIIIMGACDQFPLAIYLCYHYNLK